jgi:hypothetical protein
MRLRKVKFLSVFVILYMILGGNCAAAEIDYEKEHKICGE